MVIRSLVPNLLMLSVTLAVLAAKPAMATPSGTTHKTMPAKIFGLKHMVTAGVQTRKLFAKAPEEWRGPIIGSDGSLAYVATNNDKLSAIRLQSGQELWSRNDLGGLGQSLHQYEDAVLVGAGTDLVALDRFSGDIRWRVDIGGRVGGDIHRSGSFAVIPVRPNGFTMVDLETKKQVWRVKRPAPSGITVRGQAAPTIDAKRDRVYLGFSDGYVQAVSLATGALKWTRALAPPAESFVDVDAKPLLRDQGKLLVVANYHSGIFGLDTLNGKILWKNPEFKGIGTWWAFNDNQRIIASNADGLILGLAARAKKPAWQYKAKRGVGSAIIPIGKHSVAVSISETASVILDRETGAPQQMLEPGSGVRAPMAFRGQNLLVLSNRGRALIYEIGR